MGVIDVYFVDNEVKDYCRRKVVDDTFIFFSMLSITIGCTTVLPMGVAPKAIAEFFWV
jgi:hypothetical protein